MFHIIFKLFYIQATLILSNDDNVKDHILTNFINAFDNKKNIENWIKSRKIESCHGINLLEDILRKVRDIIAVINTETYYDVKSLITNTCVLFPKNEYLYFMTSYITNMVQRILMINDLFKMLNYTVEILYKEYDFIYYNLKWTIINVGFKYNRTETYEIFKHCFNFNFKISDMSHNLLLTINLIKLSNNMLDSIIPKKYEKIVFVFANSEGFESSRICFDNIIHFYIREKPAMLVYPDNMLQYSTPNLIALSMLNHVNFDIKDYMDKTFLCNKTTTEVLVALFHFYSEITKISTVYELIRKKDNEYQIKWTFPNNPSLEAIKKYWLKQEIPDLSTRKIIHKFGLIIDYNIQYSTKKSNDTEDKPVETRLILLSCGHQLGFELIDEFLEYFYIKYDKPLECHICRRKIFIVGSYKTFVYRCK